jgi:hypothetical protein
MTPHEWPYFIDNGAFTSDFDSEEWLALLDTLDETMPHPPDFVVLPDELNDAEATIKRHREWAPAVFDRDLRPAFVMQPGFPPSQQVALADGLGADLVFVGGECRWQRAHGREIVTEAHDRGLRAHIGNPGGKDGLLWCCKTGFDSADTSTIVQNQYWHWLEELEALRGTPVKNDDRQSSLTERFVPATDGGSSRYQDTGTDRSERGDRA